MLPAVPGLSTVLLMQNIIKLSRLVLSCPILSWIHLIDVHQNIFFEMGEIRWRVRVTDNRCNGRKSWDENADVFRLQLLSYITQFLEVIFCANQPSITILARTKRLLL